MNHRGTEDAEKTLMDEIVRRIVATMRPHKIVLFGSRARGESGPDSDVDLLVIADSKEPRYSRPRPLYGALSDIMLPMNIVVYTPEEVEEWSQVRQAFVTTAVREGRPLYEEQGRMQSKRGLGRAIATWRLPGSVLLRISLLTRCAFMSSRQPRNT